MTGDCDELSDKMALRVGVVRRCKPLAIPPLPTEGEFRDAYARLPRAGVSGTRPEGRWIVDVRNGRVFVPEELRSRVLVNFHYGPSGHLGVTRTKRRIQSLFSWPGLSKDVENMVRDCLICTRVKRPPVAAHEVPSGSLGAASALDIVSLDHVGPLHFGPDRWWILVVIDHATRYMVAKIATGMTAAETYRQFYAHWVLHFGIPKAVLTDNGTSFKGEFHQYVTALLGCRHLTSAPYRPQGNGINESSHQGLKAMLEAMWQEGRHEVDYALEAAVTTHNTTPHTSTGVSPYEALFGRPPNIAQCQGWTLVPGEPGRRQMLDRLAQERMTRILLKDRPIEPELRRELKVGDVVVLLMDEGSAAAGLGGSETPKWMSPQWSLPCRVSAVTPTQVTVRKYNDPKKTVVVHKNKVRKFEMSKDPVLRSLTGDYLEIATPVTDTPEDSRKRPRRAVAPEDELAAQRVRELFGETAVGEEGREPS